MESRVQGGLEDEAITERIIGAATAVHQVLGPGFLESVYEAALLVELRRREIAVVSQLSVPVLYHDEQVGLHRLDLVVEGRVVVELKATKALEAVHFATLHSYLRAANLRVGLLLNFLATTLQIKRTLNPRVHVSAIPCFREKWTSNTAYR